MHGLVMKQPIHEYIEQLRIFTFRAVRTGAFAQKHEGYNELTEPFTVSAITIAEELKR